MIDICKSFMIYFQIFTTFRYKSLKNSENNNGTSQIAAEAARKQYERDNPKRQYDRSVQVRTNENADRQEQNISRSRRR